MLVVSDLHAGYGLSEVLVGTSLEVKAGTVVALIGANGAGKTTTMRAISGLIKPSKGQVLLDGKPVQALAASRIARLGLAHSPEGRKVFGPLSVEDNLLLGGYRQLPRFFGFRAKASRDLDRVYGLFPRLRERRRQSGGHPLGRRAADACHRPCAHGAPKGDAARRAVHGSRARDRPGGVPDHPALEAGRHDHAASGAVRQDRAHGLGLCVRDGAWADRHRSPPAELHKNERVLAAYLG
jgi:branched-chain amino acid transport system ATP-binding protein